MVGRRTGPPAARVFRSHARAARIVAVRDRVLRTDRAASILDRQLAPALVLNVAAAGGVDAFCWVSGTELARDAPGFSTDHASGCGLIVRLLRDAINGQGSSQP